MDLSRMLSSEKRDDFTPPISQPHVVPPTPPKRARLDPALQQHVPHLDRHPASSAPLPPPPGPSGPPHPSQHAPMFNRQPSFGAPPPSAPPPSRADAERAPADSPYAELQTALYAALENNAAMLTTGDKLTLALEVLRARQLEADLVQARSNIKNIVTRSGPSPITIRAVIPTVARAGVPIGTPLDIAGKILLSPANSDPQSLLLTLELHNVRAQVPVTQPGQMAQQQMGPQPQQMAQHQPQMAQQQQMGQQVQQTPHPQTEAPRYAAPAAPGPPNVAPPTASSADANGNGNDGEQGATFSNAGLNAAVPPPGPTRNGESEQGANHRDEITPADGAQPPQSASASGAAGNPSRGV